MERHRELLRESLESIGDEALELAEVGFEEWAATTGPDDRLLVNPQEGEAVAWVAGHRPAGEHARQRCSSAETEPGVSGLKRSSYALIEQLRSIDKRRIIRAHGVVAHTELNAIDWGMLLHLGLAAPGPQRALPAEE